MLNCTICFDSMIAAHSRQRGSRLMQWNRQCGTYSSKYENQLSEVSMAIGETSKRQWSVWKSSPCRKAIKIVWVIPVTQFRTRPESWLHNQLDDVLLFSIHQGQDTRTQVVLVVSGISKYFSEIALSERDGILNPVSMQIRSRSKGDGLHRGLF